MKFLQLLRIKIDRKLPCTFLWTIRTTAMGTTRAMRGRDCALYVHIRRQQSSEPALISRRLVRVRRTQAWSGWLRACHWPTWRRLWWLVDWNSWNWEDLHNLNYLHIHIINWEDLHNLNHLTIHIINTHTTIHILYSTMLWWFSINSFHFCRLESAYDIRHLLWPN